MRFIASVYGFWRASGRFEGALELWGSYLGLQTTQNHGTQILCVEMTPSKGRNGIPLSSCAVVLYTLIEIEIHVLWCSQNYNSSSWASRN